MGGRTAELRSPEPRSAGGDRRDEQTSRATGSERAVELCDCMIEIAGALFQIPTKELRRPGRSGVSVSRARQIAMYAAHVGLGLSMSDVGRGFQRDRTTVLHACHLIEDLREDPDFDRLVTMVERVAAAALRRAAGA